MKLNPGAARLGEQWTQIQGRWRRLRRSFAQRTLSERRLLVVAGIACAWFLIDAAWVTPSYKAFNAARERQHKAETVLRTVRESAQRQSSDALAMAAQLQPELKRLRLQVADQQQRLDQLQEGLVPAREMRNLLGSLLNQNAQLQLQSMRTLAPEEGKSKAAASAESATGLYKHGLELVVQGPFAELLAWQRAVEALPRKLLWSGMTLRADEQYRLSLTVRLYTLSPDPEPIEIAAP